MKSHGQTRLCGGSRKQSPHKANPTPQKETKMSNEFEARRAKMIESLEKPFPQECVKARKGGGGKSYSYVPGHIIIRRLNEATDQAWTAEITGISERTLGDDLFVVVQVSLEIPGMGKRPGIGVQIVRPNAGEDLYKGALTDAIKKAATLFGVALDLYGEDIEGSLSKLGPKEYASYARSFSAALREVGKQVKGEADAKAHFRQLTSTEMPTADTDRDEAVALFERAIEAAMLSVESDSGKAGF